MARTAIKRALTTPVPQSEPLDERQVKNNAGGYVFALDVWKRLDRFLILGSEGATYYQSEKELTKQNLTNVNNLARTDGVKLAKRVGEFAYRAPRSEPLLYALAAVSAYGSSEAKLVVRQVLPTVAGNGTRLFQFISYVQELRGWGDGLKNIVSAWYKTKTAEDMAYDVIKYQSRDGWSHRDVMRLAHPRAHNAWQKGSFKDAIAYWVTKGELSSDWNTPVVEVNPLARIDAFERAKTASEKEVVKLVNEFNLPRECVPTNLLNSPAIWEALLARMPYEAMLRNLNKMTAIGLIKPLSDASHLVASRIKEVARIQKSHVHPIKIYIALHQYSKGRGDKGSLTWSPDPAIVAALDSAFSLSFANVEKTGKRFYLGLDVSGSMGMGTIAGVDGLTPALGTALLSMVTARTEDRVVIKGFTGQMKDLGITSADSLQVAQRKVQNHNFGSTDCALPMLDALQGKLNVDCFVVMTDNESWCGSVHPRVALERYRQKLGINARLVVVAMTSTGFTIADPNDPGTLDVVGFDTNVPSLISDFAAEKF